MRRKATPEPLRFFPDDLRRLVLPSSVGANKTSSSSLASGKWLRPDASPMFRKHYTYPFPRFNYNNSFFYFVGLSRAKPAACYSAKSSSLSSSLSVSLPPSKSSSSTAASSSFCSTWPSSFSRYPPPRSSPSSPYPSPSASPPSSPWASRCAAASPPRLVASPRRFPSNFAMKKSLLPREAVDLRTSKVARLGEAQQGILNSISDPSSLPSTASFCSSRSSSSSSAPPPASCVPFGSSEKLERLRVLMEAAAVDTYLVYSGDPHGSEIPAPHHGRRAYCSGFDGSAGTAVVTKTQALLWTDGR
eukprot:GHVT01011098.1.p1 GENE.GHVT01011098.1~~GHVT01011098.1.p1  ORF type:complete len:303 (+),score=84.71 GHVT01011098.1:211-1119(+)